jgi:hypothetical protein
MCVLQKKHGQQVIDYVQCRVSTQCQSQAAFPSISDGRAESQADILDHHRKETPSCGTFEWVIQAH